MSKNIEIGYVCHKGHFEFEGDPDGDSCATKRVATIYVSADEWAGITQAALQEVVSESLASHHRKMEEWQRG